MSGYGFSKSAGPCYSKKPLICIDFCRQLFYEIRFVDKYIFILEINQSLKTVFLGRI